MQRIPDKPSKASQTARWSVSVRQRPERDETEEGEEFLTGGVVEVVVIHDGRGNRYELTINRKGTTELERLAGFSLTAPGGIGRETLSAAPLATLQAVAEQALLQADDAREAGATTPEALAMGHMAPGEVRDGTPTPEEFAAVWNATPARLMGTDGASVPRREQLAERYEVTPWTIDKWSRRARDLGLITKQRPGRPRKTTQQEEKNQ